MIADCRDLGRALASDDPALRDAVRIHAEGCAACRDEIELDEMLSAAAGTLHREWDTPRLWPETVARLTVGASHASGWARRQWLMKGWQPVAAAALLIVLGSAAWLGWRAMQPSGPPSRSDNAGRLLSEEALTEIERSEAQYVRAIDELIRITGPRLETTDSPLLVNLRERLRLIDTAIAEYRAEIARNRFNAHLRRQLLWIYQEKRRTLEQIQESSPDAI